MQEEIQRLGFGHAALHRILHRIDTEQIKIRSRANECFKFGHHARTPGTRLFQLRELLVKLLIINFDIGHGHTSFQSTCGRR